MSKYRFKIILGLLSMIMLSAYGVASLFYNLGGPIKSEIQIVDIERGDSVRKIAKKLKNKDVIQNTLSFVLLVKLLGRESDIRWGEYEFKEKQQHPIRVLDKLVLGQVKLYRITVPEGFNIAQIAELLQFNKIVSANEFATFALASESAKKFAVPGPTLEGYLYPTTYFFRKGITTSTVAEEMVIEYKRAWTNELRSRMNELKMTEREVITLASIVEKETAVEDERKRIAGVFHNRLRKGMRLQADPTVIYGIERYDGNITKQHLNTYTPYNTYRIKGLPPGPIANPGITAIEAVLYPENTPFLYFVANRKGGHDFSTTYEEHHKKVLRHQVRKY